MMLGCSTMTAQVKVQSTKFISYHIKKELLSCSLNSAIGCYDNVRHTEFKLIMCINNAIILRYQKLRKAKQNNKIYARKQNETQKKKIKFL